MWLVSVGVHVHGASFYSSSFRPLLPRTFMYKLKGKQPDMSTCISFLQTIGPQAHFLGDTTFRSREH